MGVGPITLRVLRLARFPNYSALEACSSRCTGSEEDSFQENVSGTVLLSWHLQQTTSLRVFLDLPKTLGDGLFIHHQVSLVGSEGKRRRNIHKLHHRQKAWEPVFSLHAQRDRNSLKT